MNNRQRIFIVGVNGFIGNALVRRILGNSNWSVVGIDLYRDNIADLLDNSAFDFLQGDLMQQRAWIEEQVRSCDILVPLAAIATPKSYVTDPLGVFNLSFIENLKLIELAAKHNKRVIHPSTSEVYGMSQDFEFDEETSNLVLGPISKMRWIYSCSKQLLDRVIYAYGIKHGLQYTIFRPFNWVGPHLDRLDAILEHKNRVVTQFISDIIHNRKIQIVDGGVQRRSFLYIEDGIDALMSILINKDGLADQQIINIGNPENECSVYDLATILSNMYGETAIGHIRPFTAGVESVPGESFYGTGYQDIEHRRPSLKVAKSQLGWTPQTNLEDTMRRTLNWFLTEHSGRS